MESSPDEMSRTTAAVAGMPLMRQLPLPSALISRYKSRSSVTLVAAFFQLLFDGGRDTLKRCQMHAFCAPLRTSSREVRLPKIALIESIRMDYRHRSHLSAR